MATDSPANKYLDPKTLDKIKRLEVRARLVVEGFISGQHRSPFNGFAIEFAAHTVSIRRATICGISIGRFGRKPTGYT